ncbi:hypothetical protein BOTBODRAFT_55778 [Botryobasidium botryosum FD-172 SS1]|uniref:Protein kinase domain-containing protein n=1 Tax=Botryobasidium botryosum (strain FD-172 SS1) TaxID=930990 RepID=A0A067ME57_BOTB1|nr:hypothetical protein BOTBODRAFT_55778 [Botryobasidium botryosum FD-172 SS1]
MDTPRLYTPRTSCASRISSLDRRTTIVDIAPALAQIGRRVDGGGFGEVYEGKMDRADGRVKVALKKLRNERPLSDLRRRIQREGALWQQLEHAHILYLYGICEKGTDIYLVSPWMPNGNVMSYLRRHPTSDRHELLTQTADALAYLHDKGIVHGGIKGKNILVSEDGEALLCDVGLSTIFNIEDPSSSSSAQSSGVVRWMAPELHTGSDQSKAVDVYAFGMLALEIYTGAIPFQDVSSDGLVIQQVTAGTRPSRPSGPRNLPDHLWELIEKCWHTDPETRPDIALAFDLLSKASSSPRRSVAKTSAVEVMPMTRANCSSTPIEDISISADGKLLVVASGDHLSSTVKIVDFKSGVIKWDLTDRIITSWTEIDMPNPDDIEAASPEPPERSLISKVFSSLIPSQFFSGVYRTLRRSISAAWEAIFPEPVASQKPTGFARFLRRSRPSSDYITESEKSLGPLCFGQFVVGTKKLEDVVAIATGDKIQMCIVTPRSADFTDCVLSVPRMPVAPESYPASVYRASVASSLRSQGEITHVEVSILAFSQPDEQLRVSLFAACNDEAIRVYKDPLRQRLATNQSSLFTSSSAPATPISEIPLSVGTWEIDPTHILFLESPCSPDVKIRTLSSLTISGELHLAAGCTDGTVRVWNVDSGQMVNRLIGWHHSPVAALFIPKMRCLVSASNVSATWDIRVALGKLHLHPRSSQIDVRTSSGWNVLVLPGDIPAVWRCVENDIEIRDLASQGVHMKLRGEGSAKVQTLAISPGSEYVIAGHSDGSLAVWPTDATILGSLSNPTWTFLPSSGGGRRWPRT